MTIGGWTKRKRWVGGWGRTGTVEVGHGKVDGDAGLAIESGLGLCFWGGWVGCGSNELLDIHG